MQARMSVRLSDARPGRSEFWYSDGPGNPTSAAQGVGWVQELISRLHQPALPTLTRLSTGPPIPSNITFL